MKDSPEFLMPKVMFRSHSLQSIYYTIDLLATITDHVFSCKIRFILLMIERNCDPIDGSLNS